MHVDRSKEKSDDIAISRRRMLLKVGAGVAGTVGIAGLEWMNFEHSKPIDVDIETLTRNIHGWSGRNVRFTAQVKHGGSDSIATIAQSLDMPSVKAVGVTPADLYFPLDKSGQAVTAIRLMVSKHSPTAESLRKGTANQSFLFEGAAHYSKADNAVVITISTAKGL